MPELLTPRAAAMLLPLFLHFGLVVGLYVLLTGARLVTVRRGEARTADFARADGDAPLSARIQRNLANQFEAPVFAWIGALALVLTGHATALDIAAAWLFLVGRAIHALVQCAGDDVVLRGRVFTINFVGVIWLMGHAMLAVLGGP
jgi:hypothetical protein